MQCFSDHEEKCPGFADLKVIRDSMNSSQLIIFAVPVFVYHVPGQLKTFLDHFGWEWMVHKPNELMFKKQALIISTAAGAGMKSAVKDVKDSLDYWGIGKVYTYKKAVRAANWSGILVEKQVKMLASMDRIANRITNGSKNSTPRIKVKLMFLAFRAMHKHIHFSPSDVAYWKEKGWLGKNRPWKK